MIHLNNISKSFGNKQVLNSIGYQFELGNVYGIVGENGAGKTTLFRCIAGLESHEGEIASAYNPLKDTLGYLQTESFFFPRITGREYLQLFANARDFKDVDFDEQNVFDLPLDKYAESYSTGMKKKLALLAVLIQKNDVIILDEPFNGVDIHSNLIIQEIILKLKELGKTVLISSHIFSTLTQICDEMLHLEDGCFKDVYRPKDFADLEKEMKMKTVAQRLEVLKL